MMKIVVAGDFCPQNRVTKLIENDDYASVLYEVKSVIEHADYSIVNFECPITNGDEKPIDKCGPNLQCTEKGLEAVKWAGFDCITLANNHFLDFGKEGVENTLRACKKRKIDSVGGGMHLSEASKILYKKINNEMLAIVNCCEHEFSIATETTAGSNPLNPIQQYYAIQEARKNADYVLVIVHGGHEHYQLPSPRMQETYRFFIDAGADAIINHHQHCYSGYEIYNGKPIFYGLGNFCFDWNGERDSKWNYGYMVELNFGKECYFKVLPYNQCSRKPSVCFIENDRNAFYEKLEELNRIIANEENLTIEYNKYLSTSESFSYLFSPYSNKISMALCRKKLLPSFITRKKRKLILAYLQCESHLPKVINYLKK